MDELEQLEAERAVLAAMDAKTKEQVERMAELDRVIVIKMTSRNLGVDDDQLMRLMLEMEEQS